MASEDYRRGWDDALAEAVRRLEEDATERCFYKNGSPKPHDVGAHWLREAKRIVRGSRPAQTTGRSGDG